MYNSCSKYKIIDVKIKLCTLVWLAFSLLPEKYMYMYLKLGFCIINGFDGTLVKSSFNQNIQINFTLNGNSNLEVPIAQFFSMFFYKVSIKWSVSF